MKILNLIKKFTDNLTKPNFNETSTHESYEMYCRIVDEIKRDKSILSEIKYYARISIPYSLLNALLQIEGPYYGVREVNRLLGITINMDYDEIDRYIPSLEECENSLINIINLFKYIIKKNKMEFIDYKAYKDSWNKLFDSYSSDDETLITVDDIISAYATCYEGDPNRPFRNVIKDEVKDIKYDKNEYYGFMDYFEVTAINMIARRLVDRRSISMANDITEFSNEVGLRETNESVHRSALNELVRVEMSFLIPVIAEILSTLIQDHDMAEVSIKDRTYDVMNFISVFIVLCFNIKPVDNI